MCHLVQREVELQDVDTGFAQDAYLPVFGIGGDQFADGIGGHAASGGDTSHLGIDGFGAQVRIKAATRSGHGIAGDGAGEGGVLGAELLDIVRDAVGQFLAGGAEVATA